ncbi:MAG: ABC transporter ATP-binding protein, partial [candidate division WOR-3 bacterium]
MVLRFENVSFQYSGTSGWGLREVNFTVPGGEMVLVAGASGSGKSTLCRASVGLIPHFYRGSWQGRVWVDGLDTRDYPVYRLFGRVGLAFQNPDTQIFNQTVEAELAYGLESLGLECDEMERRLSWVSDLVGLGSLMHRPPHSLSGGEKQRVILGAILALKPRLVLLDEPFTHLDSEGTMSLKRLLQSIREEGIGLIVAEHRLHEIVADADRLVILNEGKLVADGPPRHILSDDLSDFGLNLPPLIRFFRDHGWRETPLTVSEATSALRDKLRRGEITYSMLLDELSDNRVGKSHRSENCSRGDSSLMIDVEGLEFRYDHAEVLRGVNLTLQRGETVALVGRNGSGKTTLVKHLNRLLRPMRGFVRVMSHDTRNKSVAELARHVGFAWQNPNDQLFQANVLDEVLTGPRALHAYDPEWCSHLIRRFGLEPLLDRSPFQLSEGEKKRVAFATALAAKPELVILDEPTAGQDEMFRRELAVLMEELRAEGRTVLIVTHDLEFAAQHADRWIVLADGRIVADGPPNTVMANAQVMAASGIHP